MGVDKLLFIHYSVVKAKQAAVAALEFKIHLCLNHFPIDNCLQKNGFLCKTVSGDTNYKLLLSMDLLCSGMKIFWLISDYTMMAACAIKDRINPNSPNIAVNLMKKYTFSSDNDNSLYSNS